MAIFQSKLIKTVGLLGMLLAVAGCARAPDTAAVSTLPKGEQLDIRNILAAHPNKTACVEYQAASNTCASIISTSIDGTIMTTKEITALSIPGTTSVQNVEIVSRNLLQGEKACFRAPDLSTTGRDSMSTALLAVTGDQINEMGGMVCSTYHRSGDGYVISPIAANGAPFPPGDKRVQFILGDLKLRAQ
ncbi:hypothetical protein [Sulfitobacter guttiformis]|uniref:Lipoprotein n=1 Tax=Sulfitobacter guttiformis TaxID=74349 RepID=A0A420DNN0_9RHOB|nr:hypothetical protein [Sulfitobacter guttiformis]KIN73103.1 hypothetical protein Z949_2285 [Sulfitobacter guttiformis KCTC 32187]RKE95788.1 hypothetical protein C8N30_0327 [Sulfitobacter guttiformis]